MSDVNITTKSTPRNCSNNFSARKVENADKKINALLSQSWKDWDVSKADLQKVSHIIDSLSTREKNVVISNLPDNVLNTWGNELDGALGGLSTNARSDLFKSLAKDLNTDQLVRISNAFGDDHQSMLAQAVQTQADTATRADYVERVQRASIKKLDVPEELTDEQRELYLDLAQLGLDVVGIAEPTPFADGSSGIISLFRGDWLGAGLSALSIVPYVGDLAKLGKLGKWTITLSNVIDAAGKSEKFFAVVRPMLENIAAGIDSIPEAVFNKLPKQAQDALNSLKSKISEFLVRKSSLADKPDEPGLSCYWASASLDDAIEKFASDSSVVAMLNLSDGTTSRISNTIALVCEKKGDFYDRCFLLRIVRLNFII